MTRKTITVMMVVVLILSGCRAAAGDEAARSTSEVTTPPATATEATPKAAPDVASSTETTTPPATTTPRPGWLGSRTLPTDDDGFGLAAETPPELVGRRFATIDTLPPPTEGAFSATVRPLSEVPEALARSTWIEGCPVPPEDLAYITLPFHGFDGLEHTGELIVAASAADDIVSVFERLYLARFPIEEMRIVTPDDLDAPPTGDTNNTTGFVCRPVTGGSAFSEHAKGLAIDVNPFHNPYVKGERVLPELAAVYTDRSIDGPGVIAAGDVVVEAFAAIGWIWGGDWTSLKDYQHFSATGR